MLSRLGQYLSFICRLSFFVLPKMERPADRWSQEGNRLKARQYGPADAARVAGVTYATKARWTDERGKERPDQRGR